MKVQLTCPHCGFSKEIPEEKVPLRAKRARCPRCRQAFAVDSACSPAAVEVSAGSDPNTSHPGQAADQDSAAYGSGQGHGEAVGFWTGTFQDLRGVLFEPGAFFTSLRGGRELGEPVAFGLLTGSAGFMFALFWHILLSAATLLPAADLILSHSSLGVLLLGVVVFVPLFVLLAMVVVSCIWHVLLLLVRGGGNGFSATFMVISYSQAAQVLGLIPFVGGFVAFVWQTVTQIIGLRTVHETSYSRVMAAFLIPFALFLLCAVTLLIPFALLILRSVGEL